MPAADQRISGAQQIGRMEHRRDVEIDVVRRRLEHAVAGRRELLIVFEEKPEDRRQVVDLDIAIDVGGGESDRAPAHGLP